MYTKMASAPSQLLKRIRAQLYLKGSKLPMDAKDKWIRQQNLGPLSMRQNGNFIKNDSYWKGVPVVPKGLNKMESFLVGQMNQVPPGTFNKMGHALPPKPKAVIIKGNPYYIENNPKAEAFYAELSRLVSELGYAPSFDPGEPHTSPDESAALWVGHSRGQDRLQYAPEGVKTLAVDQFEERAKERREENAKLMEEAGYKSWAEWPVETRPAPGDEHYQVTDALREALSAFSVSPTVKSGHIKAAQARWRTPGHLRTLFNRFAEKRGPGGGFLHTPHDHIYPTIRGSLDEQLATATQSNVKRILGSLLRTGNASSTRVVMGNSASRFLDRLPGQETLSKIDYQRDRSGSLLFRGIDLRGASSKPKGVSAEQYLTRGGGYFPEGVHATPSLGAALEYGSPHRHLRDLHTVGVYQKAHNQRFFDDFGLEQAAFFPRKFKSDPSHKITDNPYSPSAYETLVTPGRNPSLGVLMHTNIAAADHWASKSKFIPSGDERSMRSVLNYIQENGKLMNPSSLPPKVSPVGRLGRLAENHPETYRELLARRTGNLAYDHNLKQHSSFMDDIKRELAIKFPSKPQ